MKKVEKSSFLVDSIQRQEGREAKTAASNREGGEGRTEQQLAPWERGKSQAKLLAFVAKSSDTRLLLALLRGKHVLIHRLVQVQVPACFTEIN